MGWMGICSLTFAQTPEQELIAKVFKLITINDIPLLIYELKPMISLQGSSFNNLISQCTHADVIYGASFETLPKECQAIARFTTDYEVFQKDEKTIGAFYWRKGRPQLRFDKDRCEHFNIFLPSELVRYVQ